MTLLGIETSTAVCSVGLSCTENGAINQKKKSDLPAERSIIESHIHSEKLLTLIKEVCDSRNIMLSKLDGIAVSIGPGSFTGLRIGLSTAKGLSYSLGKPLLAVPTFEAIATRVFVSCPEFLRVIIYIDAKQGESYSSVYEVSGGNIHEVQPIGIRSIPDIVMTNYENTVIVTDQSDSVRMAYPDSVPVKDVLTFCRGDVVADLAIKKLQAGQFDSLEDLEPIYLKDFVIRSHSKSV